MLSGGKRSKGIARINTTELPLVSIITVTYNAAIFLEQALESIVNQTYPNIELIVIDGGSTDGTLDIIQRFEANIDLWLSEPDKGIYDAMNKGLALATGTWVGFKNADDWYLPTAVAVLVEHASRKEADVWYGNTQSVIQEEPLATAPFYTSYHRLGKSNGIDHRSSFVRTELHKKVLFDTRYRLAADLDAFWRLEKAGARFAHIPEFLAYKRYGGASDGTVILEEVFQINRTWKGLWFACLAYLAVWRKFTVWKVGNLVLRTVLGNEGYLRFKQRRQAA